MTKKTTKTLAKKALAKKTTTKKTAPAKKTVKKTAPAKKTVKKTAKKTVETAKPTAAVESPAVMSLRARMFKSNIDKLDMNVHRRTHDSLLGTVTLKKAASENHGKRLFSIRSKMIKSGTYTRKTLMAAIDAFCAAK